MAKKVSSSSRWQFAMRSFCAVPQVSQLGNVIAALFFVPKPFDALVAQVQFPLRGVPMLKNPAALEIVLAHDSFERLDGGFHQGVALF